MIRPTIDTLIPDMQAVLRHDTAPVSGVLSGFAKRISDHFQSSLVPREGSRTPERVWFSQLGTQCYRKEWYSVNKPELAEPLSADARFKFLYGHIIEETTLELAKAAGHDVTSCQERIEVPLDNGWALTGRIDAIIDGIVVDVKSMSTYSYRDMPADIQYAHDTFGYRMQLNGYNAILTSGKTKPALLCVDKQMGHMKLAWEENPYGPGIIIGAATRLVEEITAPSPPARRPLVPYGKGGNEALDTYCSYCAYKKECWSRPRIFLYSGKPVYMATVVIEPKVPELYYETKT